MNLNNLKTKLISISSVVALLAIGININVKPTSAQTLIAISPDGELDEYKSQTAPVLKLGDVSKHVAEVQICLKELGFYNGTISSVYDTQLFSSITEFQRSRNLTANGVVNSQTWNALINAEARANAIN